MKSLWAPATIVVLLLVGVVAGSTNNSTGTTTDLTQYYSSFFGHAVTMTKNLGFVSAPFATAVGVLDAGTIYVYDHYGHLIRTINPPVPGDDVWFGQNLATVTGNDVILVGSMTPQLCGRVYAVNATNSNFISTLNDPNSCTESFGTSFAGSNGTIIVGANGYTGSRREAYIYNMTSGQLLASLKQENDTSFGQSVGAANDQLLVGGNGTAYVYNNHGILLNKIHVTGHAEPYQVIGVGEKILVTVKDGIYEYDSNSSLVRSFNTANVTSVAATSDRMLVAKASGLNGTVELYNMTSGQLLHTFVEPTPYRNGSSSSASPRKFGNAISLNNEQVLIAPLFLLEEAYLFNINGDLETALYGASSDSPRGDFTITPSHPTVNDTVTFTAHVSKSNPPVKYYWQFGERSGCPYTHVYLYPTSCLDASSNPVTHTYNRTGAYGVNLIIADYNGAVTVGHTLVITGKLNSTKQTEPLTANFTYLSDANSFISTVTGGTPPYKYNWDFGNGITSKLAEPQHTFTAGNHTVKLTITDASTPIKTFVVNQTVTITQPPISTSIQADFTYQNPTKSDTPVPFHGVTSEGSYITNWIFGDGAMQQVGSVVQGNRTSTVTHTYTVAGTYAVTMQVRNIIGTSTNVTHYLTIQPNSSTGSNGPSPSSSSSNNNSGKSQSNNSGSSNNNSQPTPASSIPSSSQSNILNNYWYIIAILLVLVITIPVVIFAYSHLHSEIARDNSGKSEIDPVTDQ